MAKYSSGEKAPETYPILYLNRCGKVPHGMKRLILLELQMLQPLIPTHFFQQVFHRGRLRVVQRSAMDKRYKIN